MVTALVQVVRLRPVGPINWSNSLRDYKPHNRTGSGLFRSTPFQESRLDYRKVTLINTSTVTIMPASESSC